MPLPQVLRGLVQNRNTDSLVTYQASADEVIRCVHPAHARASGCSAQPRASGRNIFSPAVTQLLMLRCPAARAQAGAFRQERGCSLGAGEESSPAPSERNAKHEHNGKPHLHWMPRNRSATHEQHRQADQIPGSTAGMENRITSGMSHTRHHATVRNTGSGSRLLESAYRDTSLLQF